MFSDLEDLDFADDLAEISGNNTQLQEQTAMLNKYARQTELNIRTKKTKIMTINATPEPLTINNDQLEEVEDFTYLGTALSKDNGTGKDIKIGLSKARAAFAKLHPIWKSSKYSLSTKIHLYNSYVKSVLLYGSECRRIIESDIKKVEVFHNSYLPRTTWRRTITSELEKMYFSMGQAQYVAKDRGTWRQIMSHRG
jgi:hypothetical protein